MMRIQSQPFRNKTELSAKKAREKRMQRYNKENLSNPSDVHYRRYDGTDEVVNSKPSSSQKKQTNQLKQVPVTPSSSPSSPPPPEYEGCCVKTKFGYKIQFVTMPKPQKTPHEELTKKYKVYEARVKEAIKQQKIFRIISAYDVPTVRKVRKIWVE